MELDNILTELDDAVKHYSTMRGEYHDAEIRLAGANDALWQWAKKYQDISKPPQVYGSEAERLIDELKKKLPCLK